jgi:hypothetical protein
MEHKQLINELRGFVSTRMKQRVQKKEYTNGKSCAVSRYKLSTAFLNVSKSVVV